MKQSLQTLICFITIFTLVFGVFFDVLSIKAQTVDLPLPPGSNLYNLIVDKEPVISEAPETFDFDAESWGEVMVCSTGIYSRISSWINTAVNVVLNPICQLLGRSFSFLGIGGTAISGECTVNAGGADSVQQCREWVQKKKASLKAKLAQITQILLRIAVKTFLDRLVSQTIDWISGRTTGEPQFVTNWRQFFGNVADEALGRFIENSPFSELCEPFRWHVRVKTTLPGAPPFPRCTLSMVVNNIESFLDNFENGGWMAFEESFYPWNDAFGAYFMTQEALAYEVLQAQAEAAKKTQSGFKPTEWCIKTKKDPATGQEICVEKVVSIPGEAKAGVTTKVLTNQLDKADSYFLTAADLKEYAEMIAQALISRLVKSTKEVLIGGKWYGKGLLDLPKEGEKGESINLRYSCKTYGASRTCEYDPSGPYLSKASCEAVCGSFSMRWRCDASWVLCLASEDGPYSDYDSCQRNCAGPGITPTPPAENRFSCNESLGICELDPDGDFTSVTACEKYCGGRGLEF